VPVLLMDRVPKLAMPPTAATVLVPLRVPPPALVPMATVTFEVSVVTRLLNGSSTGTETAGEMGRPATDVRRCRTKARRLGAGALMLKNVEVPVTGRASVADRV